MKLYVRVGAKLGLVKVPKVGDPVWWAPKGLGCVVTKVETNGSVIFQGGPIVRNKNGREVPRWTVGARYRAYKWDAETQMWVVGEGPRPKRVRETIITPEPVSLSGQVTGSFARVT